MMKRLLLIFSAFMLFVPKALAQQEFNYTVDDAVIQASLDTNTVLVGGLVHLKIQHNSRAANFRLDTASGLVLVKQQTDSSQETTFYDLSFLVVDSGKIDLPLAYVSLTGDTYRTDSLNIQSFILPAQEGVERAPDRGMSEVAFNFKDWIIHYKYFLFGLLAIVLLVYLGLRYWKSIPDQPAVEQAQPAKDWFAETMSELAALRREKTWEMDPKKYYVRMGDVVRIYLSHRTGLPLTEQTTEGALQMLSSTWNKEELAHYEFIMTRADFVKFAKGQMTVEDHLSCLDRAESLVIAFQPKSEDTDE